MNSVINYLGELSASCPFVTELANSAKTIGQSRNFLDGDCSIAKMSGIEGLLKFEECQFPRVLNLCKQEANSSLGIRVYYAYYNTMYAAKVATISIAGGLAAVVGLALIMKGVSALTQNPVIQAKNSSVRQINAKNL